MRTTTTTTTTKMTAAATHPTANITTKTGGGGRPQRRRRKARPSSRWVTTLSVAPADPQASPPSFLLILLAMTAVTVSLRYAPLPLSLLFVDGAAVAASGSSTPPVVPPEERAVVSPKSAEDRVEGGGEALRGEEKQRCPASLGKNSNNNSLFRERDGEREEEEEKLVATVYDDDEEEESFIGKDPDATSSSSTSPYSIVIDGGSTGSRLHVFEFVEVSSNQRQQRDQEEQGEDDEAEATVECVRRGSFRVNSPLSMFGRLHSNRDEEIDSKIVADHLMPAFEYAAGVIPASFHDGTAVLYQATAGMRLLDDEEQEAVYDALYDGLTNSPAFAFKKSLRRSDIATLSGELEGYYGAVAANYLKGTIDAGLRMIPPSSSSEEFSAEQEEEEGAVIDGGGVDDSDHHHHRHGPIGALDMGGSSTQIVFLPSPPSSSSSSVPPGPPAAEAGGGDDDDKSSSSCDAAAVGYSASRYPYTNESGGDGGEDNGGDGTGGGTANNKVMKGDEFFSTSYLSYGVDQFRERLWDTWIADREHGGVQQEEEESDGGGGSSSDATCVAKWINNPCTFPGYEMEWRGYNFIGTGDADECVRQVRRLIVHPDQTVDHRHHDEEDGEDKKKYVVGGIEHPPVRGKFFAMSLYFFSLDSLRVLSDDEALASSWPNPSIRELSGALGKLCGRSWHDDLLAEQERLGDGGKLHAYTRPEVLPHRCFESAYMVTLLRDGYGFHPDSRDITFTFLIDGSEVEWTLGMALSLHSEQQERRRRRYNSGEFEGEGTTASSGNERELPRVVEESAAASTPPEREDDDGPDKEEEDDDEDNLERQYCAVPSAMINGDGGGAPPIECGGGGVEVSGNRTDEESAGTVDDHDHEVREGNGAIGKVDDGLKPSPSGGGEQDGSAAGVGAAVVVSAVTTTLEDALRWFLSC